MDQISARLNSEAAAMSANDALAESALPESAPETVTVSDSASETVQDSIVLAA
jgi:hypothetical protein